MTLLELMRKHQTDKAKHRFDVPFSFFFDEHRRHQVRSVLELGVKKGASLRVWEEYFPQATIYGVDLSSKANTHASERTHIFIGSQSDSALLAQVSAAAPSGFDLIVDDGSHIADDQVASVTYLWPFLSSPYGIYAIEDLHAHVKYPERFGNQDGRYPPMSEMLVRHIERRFAAGRSTSESPGICAYGGIALLLKGEQGPVLDFEPFLKRGIGEAATTK
jgi:hypothetical protein